jgi:hypothetical protein
VLETHEKSAESPQKSPQSRGNGKSGSCKLLKLW